MKVRRKATFEAHQWTGEWKPGMPSDDLECFAGQWMFRVYYGGLRALSVGDWILTWPNGDRFVVDSETFERLYEAVEEPGISPDWVLSQLAGMTFPEQGGAHAFMQRCIEEDT